METIIIRRTPRGAASVLTRKLGDAALAASIVEEAAKNDGYRALWGEVAYDPIDGYQIIFNR